MNKNDLRNKMQSGFLEAAPDVYEAVLKAAQQNKQLLKDAESQKTEGYVEGGARENLSKEQVDFRKNNVFWGNFSKYALSACAGFALFIVCLFGMMGQNQDNVYIVLDINPSVQIDMDDSCQVKKLQGLNQDGKDVIRTIELKGNEPLLQTLDAVVESAVAGDYLHEGSGILVTISVADQELYAELEDEMGRGIDNKLQIMGISGVTTAFQYADGNSSKAGRQLLEEELAGKYGIEEEELRQMSVIELIEYYQEHTAGQLKLSPGSQKELQDVSEEKDKEQEKKGSKDQQDKKPGETENKENADKPKVDSINKENQFKDKQPKAGQSENKKKAGQDSSSKTNGYNSGSGNSGQQNTTPSPQTQPSPMPEPPMEQPEPPVQPQPEPPAQQEPQDENGKEENPGSEDDKDNNGKKDENSNKDHTNNKDKNNKDKNNKDKNNKDKNSKDKNNKDKDNKDNDNKDNDNKDQNNKDNNNKDNSNKDDATESDNKDINNKNENSGKRSITP